MAKLRGYVFLDRLQPQLMSLLGATCRGYLPRANDASLTVEVAPGMDVEWLTDVALKHDDVKPGVLVVERQFGYLEFHSKYAASVQSAGAALLTAMGTKRARCDQARNSCKPHRGPGRRLSLILNQSQQSGQHAVAR